MSSSLGLKEKNGNDGVNDDDDDDDDDRVLGGDVKPKYERNQSSGESSNVDNWFESSNSNVQAPNPAIMEGKLSQILKRARVTQDD